MSLLARLFRLRRTAEPQRLADLLAAYARLDERLEPFTAVLTKSSAASVAASLKEVGASDLASEMEELKPLGAADALRKLGDERSTEVLAPITEELLDVVYELRTLTRRRLLRWRPAPPPAPPAGADDAALVAHVEQATASWKECEALLDAAAIALAQAARALLAYGFLGWDEYRTGEAQGIDVVGPSSQRVELLVPGEPAPDGVRTRLARTAEQQLEAWAARPNAALFAAPTSQLGHGPTVGVAWLCRCLASLTEHRSTLEEAWTRNIQAAEGVLAARRQHAREERGRQEQQAERALADKQAAEAAEAAEAAAELPGAFAELDGDWPLSAKRMRRNGWLDLYQRLRLGPRDGEAGPEGDEEGARYVLRLLAKASKEGPAEQAAAELQALLDREDELVGKAERLLKDMTDLPVTEEDRDNARGVGAHLRPTCARLTRDWDELRPLLEAHAPDETRMLGEVLRALR